jgi:ribosomal protein S18 acetylase RimI-like enzyme
MLAVDENYRKRKIGGTLVKKAIEAMIADTVDEVVLETEVTNKVIRDTWRVVSSPPGRRVADTSRRRR